MFKSPVLLTKMPPVAVRATRLLACARYGEAAVPMPVTADSARLVANVGPTTPPGITEPVVAVIVALDSGSGLACVPPPSNPIETFSLAVMVTDPLAL